MLTATELDAMPVGQIVLDRDREEWRKTEAGWFYVPGEDGSEDYDGHALIGMWGPMSRRETHVEQPMPTASTGPSMHELAVGEIRYRADVGLDRHKRPLQAMNGRDAVRDTIEELADGLAYAMQIREERRLLRAELVALMLGPLRDVDGPAYETLGKIIDRYFPEETS